MEEGGAFIVAEGTMTFACNNLDPENEYKSATTGKVYKINFRFHCNGECVAYLLTARFVENLGYVLINTNSMSSCMEKEEGSLIRKSGLNIFIVKTIVMLTKY